MLILIWCRELLKWILTELAYTRSMSKNWIIGLTLVQLSQNTQLLEGFFARTELLASAGIDFLILIDQKTETKAKLGCPLYNSFLISSLKICFLWTNYMYVSNVACLPEVYYKCSNTKFASENGLLSSSKWRKWSVAALR